MKLKVFSCILAWLAFAILYNIIRDQASVDKINFERLKVASEYGDQDVLNVIIPGMCHPPLEVFDPFVDSMCGDVFVADFDGKHWDTESFQEDLLNFLAGHPDYKTLRIFTISIGDKLVRDITFELENYNKNFAVYAINPCSSKELVQPSLSKPLKVALPLVNGLISALGPVADIKFIRVDSIWHSLAELSSQGMATIFEESTPAGPETYAVLSEEDEFVDNKAAEKFLEEAYFLYIPGSHANLIVYRDDFLSALELLGAFD